MNSPDYSAVVPQHDLLEREIEALQTTPDPLLSWISSLIAAAIRRCNRHKPFEETERRRMNRTAINKQIREAFYAEDWDQYFALLREARRQKPRERKKTMKPGKVRLTLEFGSIEKMAEWLDSARDPALGVLPPDSAIYTKDDLDATAIPSGNEFILRREGDRPEQFRVIYKNTETTERPL